LPLSQGTTDLLKSQTSSTKSQTNPPAAQGTSGQVSNSKAVSPPAVDKAVVFLFGILNFGHAQRRRLRRVLKFICHFEFVIWNFH
jgi:hypothetical protein